MLKYNVKRRLKYIYKYNNYFKKIPRKKQKKYS